MQNNDLRSTSFGAVKKQAIEKGFVKTRSNRQTPRR
jgi:hypothetical protein